MNGTNYNFTVSNRYNQTLKTVNNNSFVASANRPNSPSFHDTFKNYNNEFKREVDTKESSYDEFKNERTNLVNIDRMKKEEDINSIAIGIQPIRHEISTPSFKFIDPRYGNSGNANSLLKLDEETASRIANQFSEHAQRIIDIWSEIMAKDVATINNSWAADEAHAYVDKLVEKGEKLKNVVEALRLLADTYNKVAKQGEEVQQEVNFIIRNL